MTGTLSGTPDTGSHRVERRRQVRRLPAEFRYPVAPEARLEARGKFLFEGPTKVYLRGTTYGTFRPDTEGQEFHDAARVEADFAQMAAAGLNSVRTYTVPPRWLLDLAQRHRLRVMVGIPWEQHVTFLDDRGRARTIEDRVRAGVASCAGHPAVACYAIGNEIPSSIVRWHGPRPVERFLRRLYRAAKAEDPAGLVTYVNFPSTEYLEVPADLLAFNVYLESQERLEAYLARVHNLAGERPVVMAEIGLDSRRHGEAAQAQILDWQVRTAFAAGCAGAFVFSWTDEWHRGGHDIVDWDFGLTDRERRPKAALAAVRSAFEAIPLPRTLDWPRISVVVCSFNGARTVENTCRGLQALDYPDYEVLVIDDGSSDRTAEIAARYGFRVIRTPNRGLSAARNTGWQEATGEIVAYTDDDAYPDRCWLQFLAAAFRHSSHAAIGGPNIAPPEDPPLAQCVANAPGGPVHVLLDDRVAEHIPGCNMAFRRSVLETIGGFDEQFRAAGDDVDICWRIQERGGTIGYAPAAMVWHHRRSSLRAYWRQQIGYGKAEALLERKWPEKYNSLGHVTWGGRLYGRGLLELIGGRRQRVYFGVWGSAPFQRMYATSNGGVLEFTATPEWHLLTLGIMALVAWGWWWMPVWLSVGTLAAVLMPPVTHAILSARRASFAVPAGEPPITGWKCFRLRAVVALLYLAQPIARLRGRLLHGLTPWRWSTELDALALPVRRTWSRWSEEWQPAERWLDEIEWWSWEGGAVLHRGDEFRRFDLEVRGGLLGRVRLLLALEEHGAGRQMVRARLWPVWSGAASRVAVLMALLLAAGHWYHAPSSATVALWAVAGFLVIRGVQEAALAMGTMTRALKRLGFARADEKRSAAMPAVPA